jgi:predicted ATPase
MAFPVEKAQWSNYGLRPDRIKTARVTSANDYRLTRLPAGDYFVVAVDESQESRWQEPAFLEAAARVATRVSLAWGDTKMLDVTMAVVR